jgi:hypothetical protein
LELIVPIQCEYYALEGLGQLLRNVSLVQQNINPGLRLTGIVMTMFDPRTKLSGQVVQEVRNYFGEVVYDVIIPRTVRLSEAPGFGQPITVYDPKSKGAECYRELAREVALRPPPPEPMPVYTDLPTVVVPPVDDTVTQDSTEEPELEEMPTVREVVQAAASEPAAPAAPPPPAPAEPPSTSTEETAPPAPAASQPTVEEIDFDLDLRISEDVWEDDAETSAPPERRVVVIDEDAELTEVSEVSEVAEVTGATSPPGPGAAPPSPAPVPRSPGIANIGATLETEDVQPKRRWRLFRKGGE